MNPNQYDQFNVILTGKINSGSTRNNVIKRVAQQLQVPVDSISSLINGNKVTFKQHIPHAKAFTYQQQLNQCGLEVYIERVNQAYMEPSFSLVPEGEEQTPYKELANRYQNGEKVQCNACGSQQILAPYCNNCGKPLVATAIDSQVTQNSSTRKLMKVGSILILLLSITNTSMLLLNLPAPLNHLWLSSGLVATSLLFLWLTNRQPK